MKLIEKEVTVKYLQTTFGEFKYHEVLKLLEDLEGTSYWGGSIVIHNKKMREWLESEGVIHTSVRGSSYETEKREEFANQIIELDHE